MRKNLFQGDFVLKEHHKEQIKGLSLTQPDETLTIKEIVQKHVRGQAIADTLMRTPAYDSGADFDSDDLEKLRDEDIFDREEKLNAIKQKIEENKEKQKSFFSEKKKKAASEAELREADRAAQEAEESSRSKRYKSSDDERSEEERPKQARKPSDSEPPKSRGKTD